MIDEQFKILISTINEGKRDLIDTFFHISKKYVHCVFLDLKNIETQGIMI